MANAATVLLMRHVIFTIGLAVCLSHCGGPNVAELNRPVTKLRGEASRGQVSRHHAEIHQLISQARKLEKKSPELAITTYLGAAYRMHRLRDVALLPMYNHAVGQVIDLLVDQSARGGGAAHSDRWGGRVIKVEARATDSYGYGLVDYDDILPCDMLRYSGWRKDIRANGVGAAFVARLEKQSLSKNYLESLPYRPAPSGYSYPLTGVIDFSTRSDEIIARIRLIDPTRTAQINFWGQKRKLASNFTAPLAVSLYADKDKREEGRTPLLGVFQPQRFSDRMGVYSLTPLDTGRIPVVLVHGLNADPMTWRNVLNELNVDPVLRKRYQFLAFYYPTGLPLRASSVELKRGINAIHRHYLNQGKGANANRMVIIGHSLGGLLASAQVRHIQGSVWKKAFKSNIDKSMMQSDAMKDLNYLINGPKPTFVKRVVFIATPHRGSRRADIYIVRVLSSLVRLPEKVLDFNAPETAEALTDFGRAIFGTENPANSLTVLRSQSTSLTILTESKIYPYIKYHSIMGDRGRGDTPNSSDGVVDYSSSHLDGAKSEHIVPADHSAHEHPQAIREIRRILHKHLKSK